ncbi:MAG: aminotransferase class IV [Candidatus Omnitrophota bacterium]
MEEIDFGIFETMRSRNKKIIYFNRHLERMRKSAKALGLSIPYSSAEIKRLIAEAVKQCRAKDVRLRLVLCAGKGKSRLTVSAKKYQPPAPEKYKRGYSVCISDLRQAENSFLARLKLVSRIPYELSYRQAKDKNFDEAIILNNRGYICEASRSNIFFIKGSTLFTPSLECSCLPGISRRVVFDIAAKNKIPVYEGKFTIADLANADAAFLTNSLIGVMPLTKIENKPINKRRPHPLIRLFMHRYASLV